MPSRPSFRPRSVRRPRSAPVAAAVLAGLTLVGCTADADSTGPLPSGSSSTASSAMGPTASAGMAATPDPSAVAAAVDDLLTARDEAVTDGDDDAFRATVAAPGSADGRAQLDAFRAARSLRVEHLSHDVVAPVDDPAAVDVTLRYRVAGVDRADRTATVRYTVAPAGGGWRVVAEQPSGSEAAPPWLAMPDLRVRRTGHAVVAGTAGEGALRAAATTVDRALPDLARHWARTPRRTLVLLPETTAEADALRGGSAPDVGTVAASTDGPVDADGRATGDRVVLDPDARRRLSATGRDVVLTHELVHVAVRASLPGSAPPWLAEGYADHVGYARAGLPQRTLAARLVEAVRAGTAPTRLPATADLDPAVSDIEVGYLAAWQAAETVVALRGEADLRRLVSACTVAGGPEAAEALCADAMPGVLGVDADTLTRRWQERLDRLAR